MPTYPAFHGIWVYDGSGNTAAIAVSGFHVANVAIADGSYFACKHSAGGDTNQLCEEFQDKLDAVAGLADITVTLNSTGFVTIAASNSFNIGWIDTTVRDALGFTGNLASANTYTATEQAKYTWYPNEPPATMSGHENTQGVIVSDAVVTQAPSGQVLTTKYNETTGREIEFRLLQDEYVFPVGSVTNRDYQAFWSNVLCESNRFRYYPDRTTLVSPSSGAPWEYCADEKTVQDGTDRTSREAPSWSKFWQLKLGLHKYVAP